MPKVLPQFRLRYNYEEYVRTSRDIDVRINVMYGTDAQKTQSFGNSNRGTRGNGAQGCALAAVFLSCGQWGRILFRRSILSHTESRR
jgi:hypothetical protein